MALAVSSFEVTVRSRERGLHRSYVMSPLATDSMEFPGRYLRMVAQ
jgi:hypothetical protein